MARKSIVSCDLCGRPLAKDAAVRVRLIATRGPEEVAGVQLGDPILACPVCARTRRFVVSSPEPPARPQGEGSPSS